MKEHHLNDKMRNEYFEFLNNEFKNNEIDFKQLIDEYRSLKDGRNVPCLYRLLYNYELIKELIESDKLTVEDLRYLLNKIDYWRELDELTKNICLLKYIAENEMFQELVDKLKSMECLDTLLYTKDLSKELIENNKLNTDDLKYLLNTIDNFSELRELCSNTSLIKYILNEFVLNKKVVDRFNSMIENDYWCKDHNIHTVFDLIEYYIKYYINDQEVLKLNELNRKVYVVNNFNFIINQKLELYEVLKNNEVARNRLKEIVDNNLESNYNFEQLMQFLKKHEKRNLLNI